MPKKQEVAITGFYGQNNFGDDLFVEYLYGFFKNKTHIALSIYGASPLRGKYKKYCKFPLKKLYGKNIFLDKFLRVLCTFKMSLLSDTIIYGGGSVFGKYSSYKLRKLVVFFSGVFKTKLIAYGVSVGPFVNLNQKEKYISLLENFEKVFVRDLASALELESSSVNYFRVQDMILNLPFFYPDLVKANAEESKNYLLISVHLYDMTDYLFEYIMHYKDCFSEVVFLDLDDSCVEVSLFLLNKLECVGVSARYISKACEDDSLGLVRIISSAKYLITSKLHGAIVAATYCTPFYLFEYQEKCSAFLSDIKYLEFNTLASSLSDVCEKKDFLVSINSKILECKYDPV